MSTGLYLLHRPCKLLGDRIALVKRGRNRNPQRLIPQSAAELALGGHTYLGEGFCISARFPQNSRLRKRGGVGGR